MSLTDRVLSYVLVRRSSIQQLNAGTHRPVKHIPNYPVGAALSPLLSAGIAHTPTSDCTNLELSFAGCSRATKGTHRRSVQTAETSPASSQNRGLASPCCHAITNTKLAATSLAYGTFHKTSPETTDVASAQDLGREPDRVAAQAQRSSSVFLATTLQGNLKHTAVRKPKGGRFVMGNLRIKNGVTTVTLVKPTAESPKVAPHPGDKDIPLVTNSSGLLESRLSASFDNPALSKTSLDAAPYQI